MKVRLGFVSNSSSVSFTIYGIYVEGKRNNCIEEIRNIAGEMGLFTHYDRDGEDAYIGRKWSDIKDNETGAEFKKSVKEKISLLVLKASIKDATLCTFEEGWYDG